MTTSPSGKPLWKRATEKAKMLLGYKTQEEKEQEEKEYREKNLNEEICARCKISS